MPKSRVRKTEVFTPPPKRSANKRVSPPWLAPTMVGFMLRRGALAGPWIHLQLRVPRHVEPGRPGRQPHRGLRAAGDRTRPRHAVALDGSQPGATNTAQFTLDSPLGGESHTCNSSTTVIHTGDNAVRSTVQVVRAQDDHAPPAPRPARPNCRSGSPSAVVAARRPTLRRARRPRPRPPMWACQLMPDSEKVSTRFRPIVSAIGWMFSRSLRPTTSSAPKSPKIAPDAPSSGTYGGVEHVREHGAGQPREQVHRDEPALARAAPRAAGPRQTGTTC